jgi:hypothetical protein
LIVFSGVVSDTISFAVIYNKKISLMKAKNCTCLFLFLKKNRINKGLLLADTCHCTFKGYSLEEVNLYLMTANELVLFERKRDVSVRNKEKVFKMQKTVKLYYPTCHLA